MILQCLCYQMNYQEVGGNHTNFTIKNPIKPSKTAIMTLQMQFGLVTCFAASSILF